MLYKLPDEAESMQMLINYLILQEKERYKENKIKEKASSKIPPRHPGQHGNHHNASAYFNQPLDNIIQGLNKMVPLFVEKCVHFIEEHGMYNKLS